MTAPVTLLRPADRFSVYFTERLWEMIPEVYRHEDGIAGRPGVLRALVELMADQAAIVRRSHDRLWEDQYAELCNDWALPYIADLVGARLTRALDGRARRVTVAKSIHYRRRAGTLPLLEQLTVDVTGWDAAIAEQFHRLARARHLLDPRPTPYGGRVSRTMPGGWADLRVVRGAQLAGGPVDEFHYTPDVRRHLGESGRFGISKLGVHLYRLAWYEMIDVMPFDQGGGRYSFDPAGRDIPLFAPRQSRESSSESRRIREWELAAPLSCRILGDAAYEIGESLLVLLRNAGLSVSATNDLRKLLNVRIRSERALFDLVSGMASNATNRSALTAPAMFAQIRDGALVADCGSAALLAAASDAPAALRVIRSPGGLVPRNEVAAANLAAWPALSLTGRTIAIDPALGRFMFLGGPLPGTTTVRVNYHYGFSGDIGAGPYERRYADEGHAAQTPTGGGALTATLLPTAAMSRIADSGTYTPVADRTGVDDMTVIAAHGQRPYVRIQSDWVLDTGAQTDSKLLLDGLWIGSRSAGNAVVLRGDYELVVINRCTLDPGNERSNGTLELPAVEFIIEGHVERLVIRHSILGPISARGANGVIERLEICDSIVQATEPPFGAIVVGASASAISAGEVTLHNVTILGDVAVNRLTASGAIVTGVVTVVDTQRGCFRFSSAMTGSTLPRQYESHSFETDPSFAFVSLRFGQPGFAQLSGAAPSALVSGGEDGIEMGAFAGLGTPKKREGLTAKLEEFLPFGLVPVFITQT